MRDEGRGIDHQGHCHQRRHSHHDSDVANEEDGSTQDDLGSSEAAGVVRGLSRSIRMVQRSLIGRLPRRRVSVKRIGRLSDRASRGLDLFANFAESQDDVQGDRSGKGNAKLHKARVLQVGVFGFSKLRCV